MRDFIKRALTKLNKLTAEQIRDLLISSTEEIDRLETVLDSLNQGILVCDTEYSLILANKYTERYVLGSHYEADKPIWNSIREDSIRDFLENALTHGDRIVEQEFDVDIMGLNRLLSISVLPLVQKRKVTGSLVYIEDITEKRGKEVRLRRAENLASLTTLAAGVAHEIKNPLGSLSIHIQLIQKLMASHKETYYADNPDAVGEAQSINYFATLDNYIAVVNEEIDRLNHIVVDFLFAVRPMDMVFREGSINALIEELINFIRFEFEENNIQYMLNLDEDLPYIDFDERYIKQALLNLIKNAIAAMPNGGTLRVCTELHSEDILITIKDTGIGIPEDILPKIFEPYFTTKAMGSGLGLTLVFRILQEHKGEIAVKSKEGEGTAITLTLPIPQKETRLITHNAPQERRDEI